MSITRKIVTILGIITLLSSIFSIGKKTFAAKPDPCDYYGGQATVWAMFMDKNANELGDKGVQDAATLASAYGSYYLVCREQHR